MCENTFAWTEGKKASMVNEIGLNILGGLYSDGLKHQIDGFIIFPLELQETNLSWFSCNLLNSNVLSSACLWNLFRLKIQNTESLTLQDTLAKHFKNSHEVVIPVLFFLQAMLWSIKLLCFLGKPLFDYLLHLFSNVVIGSYKYLYAYLFVPVCSWIGHGSVLMPIQLLPSYQML